MSNYSDDLYSIIKNPLNDSKTIKKLIDAYSNRSKGFGGFYNQLTASGDKQFTRGQIYPEDRDKFYSMLFNKWKNSIVAMTENEFSLLYKNGSYGKDFIKMRNYLRGVSDVSTMEEANSVFWGNKNDKELEGALDKYRWSSLGESSGWVHVSSRDLTAKKDPSPNIEHRLYINTESVDTYKMLMYFIVKCDENHLPYYFKFDQYGNRCDTIVIYSSSEYLMSYIEILQRIKIEHSELVSRVKEPPILSGKIDSWIGYGSEPEKINGKRTSFNKIRTELVEPIIEKSTKDWVLNHLDMQISYQGRQIKMANYILIKLVDAIIEKLEKRFHLREKQEKTDAQNDRRIYDETIVVNKVGYSLEDIRKPSFGQKLYSILGNDYMNSLTAICNDKYDDVKNICFNGKNGIKINFSFDLLDVVIENMASKIALIDNNYVLSIKKQIRENSRQYGIDSDNFCFDISAREKLENVVKKNVGADDLLEKQGISKPIIQFLKNNNFDFNKISSVFNKQVCSIKTARKSDFDYTLTWGNINYTNKVNSLVHIKDIIGSFGLEKDEDFLKCVSKFYNDNDNYGARGLNKLYGDIFTVVDSILDLTDPVKLIEIDGKYYVGQDGNHRVLYMMLAYLVLKEKYKNNPQMLSNIENKFYIEAEVIKKTNYGMINDICYCLSKCWNDDLKLSFKNNSDVIAILQMGDKTYNIKSESDFVNYFNSYISSLDKTSKKYLDLEAQLSKIGFISKTSNDFEKKNNKNDVLDSQSIMNVLNPALLKRNLKIPNGRELSASEYIQEIFSHLPANGIVILNNGSTIPVKQFIEECVMSDCQLNYNGNFPKYIMNNTRNNMGLISINYGNEKYEINPVQIVDYIGKEILEKRVMLPNGVSISYEQFIQEFYAPYIPANGVVILKNGVEISVIQFIEEDLLYNLQGKYRGDIVMLLYEETKGNNGIINNNIETMNVLRANEETEFSNKR